jgi:hypothetical protein
MSPRTRFGFATEFSISVDSILRTSCGKFFKGLWPEVLILRVLVLKVLVLKVLVLKVLL